MKRTKKPILKTLSLICLCVILIVSVITLGINHHVTAGTASRILSPQDAALLDGVDCILVLGCYVHENGTLSHMLEDRVKMGVELYHLNAAPKLLMSGDHGRQDYNEVAAMKNYAVKNGVPSYDIFSDHAGFSSYESVYRAKEIFAAQKILIVTQRYHLHRALYIAEQLGIEAYGVACDYREYAGQMARDAREVLARVKDVVVCMFKPQPTFLGDSIPVSGNGDITD